MITQQETQAETRIDYYANPAISNSKLSDLKNNVERFYAVHVAKTLAQSTTPEMVFGNLVHCLTFEPQKAAERYAIVPNVDRRTKQGKADWAEFLSVHGGQQLIEQHDLDVARRMVDAIWDHSDARSILSIEAEAEAEVYFESQDIDCKAKIDWVGRSIIADIRRPRIPRQRLGRSLRVSMDTIDRKLSIERRLSRFDRPTFRRSFLSSSGRSNRIKSRFIR